MKVFDGNTASEIEPKHEDKVFKSDYESYKGNFSSEISYITLKNNNSMHY